jgi:carbon storage regulator
VLVLTRKVGEGIAIGDDVKIIVMQIKGKQVRLGIKASPTTAVHREEIYQKIQDENVAASKSGRSDLDGTGGFFSNREVGNVPVKKHQGKKD